MPLTLPPAQNAAPAPVSSNTPTSGFSPQALIIARRAGVSVSDIALRTSGRFSVMMATRSRITQSSSSVPVSILVSVVMVPPVVVFPSLRVASVGWAKSEALPTIRHRALSIDGGPASLCPPYSASKLLHPRTQFDLPGPGAARLLQHVPVAQRDRVGIEHRVRPVGGLATRSAADAAVSA